MTLLDLKYLFHKNLYELFDKDEMDSFFFLTLEFILGKSRLEYSLNRDLKISKNSELKFMDVISRLKKQEPIQYILGETEFFGLKFRVNDQVLIPRQETEELIDLILKSDKVRLRQQPLDILDIGTGSGCIAVSLAKHIVDSNVFAIDISESALQVAMLNARQNKSDISFKVHDILSSDILTFGNDNQNQNKYDIIVSNPPYVRQLEQQEMKTNVLAYEPELALFVPNDDALVFYSAIAKFALDNLRDEGWVYFEINQYLGAETTTLLEKEGFQNIKLKKDLLGNDRMVKAQLK